MSDSIDKLNLNASQKLAAFLVIMGEDAAAEIVKNFDDNERELVCAEMANLPLLDSQQQGEVLQEFTEMAVEARSGVSGSVDFTRSVLQCSQYAADHWFGFYFNH